MLVNMQAYIHVYGKKIKGRQIDGCISGTKVYLDF